MSGQSVCLAKADKMWLIAAYQAFKKMIADGRIIWEFRLHLKSDTAIRDNGSGFRTGRKNISSMYEKEIKII